MIDQARKEIPEFNVTTDIIVGFPGETDDEWGSTLKNVESIGFGHIHIFAFSSREGTKAAGLQNHISDEIKKQRSLELHLLADQLKKDFHQNQIKQEVDVLWEAQKKNEKGKLVYSGYAPNFCRVESIGLNDVLLEGRVKRTQVLDYSSAKGIFTGKVL